MDIGVTGNQPVVTPETDNALEGWLKTHVTAICDAVRADPSQTVTPDHVRATLAMEDEKAAGKR